MADSSPFAHPYIPNSAPAARADMLRAIGVESPDELYAAIPPDLRLQRSLDLPRPLLSELDLRRHIEQVLSKNKSCADHLSFLGGGCWQHYVPAVCDEVVSRAEFLTAYGGDTYADLGKYQAIFEFQSLIGELVGMEVVSTPTFDWAAAASSAVLMAARITGRRAILVPRTMGPERFAHMRNFTLPWAELRPVDFDPATGLLDLGSLRGRLAPDVAAVYFENPSYLGIIEPQGQTIAELAHAAGALSVVGVDAISLGVLAPPSEYGADIVCGDVQSLGAHMQYGGGPMRIHCHAG
jgi:glycine dehydrogenase subunit 1